jgi:putative membrane protein
MRSTTYETDSEIDHQRNPWKGLAAGLIGGLVASWTMNQFQAAWSATDDSKSLERAQKRKKIAQSSAGSSKHQSDQPNAQAEQQSESPNESADDTTVKVASAISEGVFDHKLTKREKKIAGPAVHYVFGSLMGGLYGVTVELKPKANAGRGILFGTALWLVADEGAVPLLGFSKSPAEYPLSMHVYALVSHFVYGLATESVRRLVRKSLR